MVSRRDIEGICSCGYLTLRPAGDFEEQNGGMTVKRSQVVILRDDGTTVKVLPGKGINLYGACNACANNWR